MGNEKELSYEERDIISFCVDIRNSTNMYKILGKEKAAKIIAQFLSELCNLVKTKKYNQGFINRAKTTGDGMIFYIYTKDNSKAFSKSIDFMKDLEKFIVSYKNEVKKFCGYNNFEAGLGVSYGENDLETNIENLDFGTNFKFDNNLVIGESVFTSCKLSNHVPFIRNGVKHYTKVGKKYYDELIKKQQDEEDNFIHNRKNTFL